MIATPPVSSPNSIHPPSWFHRISIPARENNGKNLEKKELLFKLSLDLRRNCLGSESEVEWCEVVEVSTSPTSKHAIWTCPEHTATPSKYFASLSQILWRINNKTYSPTHSLFLPKRLFALHLLNTSPGAWHRASAAKQIRNALLCVIMQQGLNFFQNFRDNLTGPVLANTWRRTKRYTKKSPQDQFVSSPIHSSAR